MAAFTKEQIEKALDAKSSLLTLADVERIAKAKETVVRVIDDFPDNWSKARRQATALFELIEWHFQGKRELPLEALQLAAGALIYLSAPLDLVPDDQEDGYADDAAIVSLAAERNREHIREFCEATGRNAAEYLD